MRSAIQRFPLGFSLVVGLGLVTAMTAVVQAEFDMPAGGSQLPPSSWPEGPANNQYLEFNGYGQQVGVWSCIQWEQLPDGDDITCGYVEQPFPLPDPGKAPPYIDTTWACIPAPNVFIYSVPFNQGSCIYWSSPPNSAFIPTEEEIQCAQRQQEGVLSNMGNLPPNTTMQSIFERNRFSQELIGIRRTALDMYVAFSIEVYKHHEFPIVRRLGVVTDMVATAEQYYEIANAIRPVGEDPWDYPSCVGVGSSANIENGGGNQRESVTQDDDFRTITPPQPPTLEPFSAGDGLTEQEADAANSLLANQYQAIGYSRALGIALDKADLAAAAGETYWEQRQVQAAKSFAGQLAGLLEEQVGLFAELAEAFRAAGHIIEEPLDEQAVWDYLYSLSTLEASDNVRSQLAMLGATAAEQDMILLAMLGASPSEVVALGGGKFPDLFTDPAFVAVLEQSAALYSEFAGSSTNVFLPLVSVEE